MTTSKCTAKHTLYQPKDAQWKCPECGADVDGGFYIYYGPGNDECELLHSKDTVVCDNCDHSWMGERLSKIMEKKSNSIPCPHCKGTGFIVSGQEKTQDT